MCEAFKKDVSFCWNEYSWILPNGL